MITMFRLKPLTVSLLLLSGMSVPLVAGAEIDVAQLDTTDTANQLGWQADPDANLCGGNYIEPLLGSTDPNISIDPNQAVQIDAQSGDIHSDGLSTFNGDVSVTQPGRWLRADTLQLWRNAQTQSIERADMQGLVLLREPSKLTVGNSASIKLNQGQGTYYDVIYRMALPLQPIILTPIDSHSCSVHGVVTQGKAARFMQLGKGLYRLRNATYSTCSPTNSSWHLKAKTIDLNNQSGRGVAHSAVIYAHQIPVFYTPYFNFPLDKRRMTGFLSPTYGNSTTGGIYVSTPFYWNLAPQTDMTVTPSLYSKRGTQLATTNRYLTQSSKGEISMAALPNDQAFSSFQSSAPAEYPQSTYPSLTRLLNDDNDRWYYSLKDETHLNSHWQGHVDYTQVSDDYYQEDFNLPSLTTAQLLQQADMSYSNTHWNGRLMLQNYQTLHPVNLLSNSNQYKRMPDLSVNANYPDVHYFDYNFIGQSVYFTRSLNPGETYNSDSGQPTSGTRVNLQPGITLPFVAPAGYVKPTLQLQSTQYNLQNQTTGYDPDVNRSLPIFNIDSGLYFDRDTQWFGTDYQQTLEPRLYYLYVPYQDQYELPLFDTGSQPFTFDQLFTTNRFTGIDRMGDANQVSLALTTRFLDSDSGMEKAKFGVGRIFYAENRRVMLCTTPGCTDSSYTMGSTSSTESASPIVGLANYNLNKDWSATGNLAWDPIYHQTENGNVSFQFKPKPNHIINVGYNFIRYGDQNSPATESPTDPSNNLNQLGGSFVWPLTPSWQAMASWNYNISHDHSQTFLYGVTYNACCYAVRLSVGKTFTALNGDGNPMYNQQVYLQLVLKGMGGVGTSSAVSTLTSSIPGYEDEFNKATV